METLRKNHKEMLDFKNIVREMKNAFGGLINRMLDTAEERISELEDIAKSKEKKAGKKTQQK